MAYKYRWLAKLNDGTELKQFDGETENTFGLVTEHEQELDKFCLIDSEGICRYSVDMKSGDILRGEDLLFKSPFRVEAYNPKPVFWRRNKVTLLGTVGEPEVVGYILGWQATIPNENSVVNQFLILENDTVVALDKLGRPVTKKEISARSRII